MANRVFELKFSRVEKLFQFIMLLLILSLIYPLLSVWMWLLSTIAMMTVWFFFLKRNFKVHPIAASPLLQLFETQ